MFNDKPIELYTDKITELPKMSLLNVGLVAKVISLSHKKLFSKIHKSADDLSETSINT